MEERIDYKGMTSQPSDYQCGDGDMQVAVNAEFRDGAYHATREPKDIKFEKENFKPLFIHRPNSEVGDIVIGALNEDDNFVVKAYKISNGEDIKIETNITFNSLDEIGNFCSIGNIFMYTLLEEVSYAYFSKDRYIIVSKPFPFVNFYFAAARNEIISNYKNSKYTLFKKIATTSKLDLKLPTVNYLNSDYYAPDISDNYDGIDFLFSRFNKLVETSYNNGRLMFPTLVRYAIKLYDGTHINVTPSILLFPFEDSVKLGVDDGKSSAGDSESPSPCPTPPDIGGMEYATTNTLNGTAIFYSQYKICFKLNQSSIDAIKELSKYENLIAGIDIFMSKQIYTIRTDVAVAKFHDGNNEYMPSFVKTRELDDIDNITNFYLIKSYTIQDLLKLEKNKYIDLLEEKDYNNLKNIEQKQLLKFDSYSNCVVFAKKLSVYNSRLNMANIKRSFPNLVDLNIFCPPILGLKKIAGSVNNSNYGSGENEGWTENLAYFIPSNYLLHEYSKEQDDFPNEFYQQYNYKINKGLYYCLNPHDDTIGDDNKPIDTFYKFGIKAYSNEQTMYEGFINNKECIYLPLFFEFFSNRGVSFWVNYKNDKGIEECSSIDLKQSEYKTSSYYFFKTASDLKIAIKKESNDSFPTKHNAYDYFPTLLKTSEVRNPLIFEDENSTECGNISILSISTNSRSTSQGQFGQYPLYAFCTDGVFAISVGNDGTLQSCVPLSYDILTDANSVGNMDTDIVFATRNGIIALNGGERRILLPADKTATYAYDNCPKNHQQVFMQGKDGQSGAIKNIVGISPLQMTNLYDYITNGVRFVYDATHARLIAYNHKYDYSYIMEASSGMWSVFNKGFDSHLNIPEQCLMLRKENDQFKVYDYSSDKVVDLQKSYLITRPFKLGYPDIHKSIHSIIQRGVFCNINDVQQCVYASNDLYHWFPVWSSTNIYLRGMRGSGYKYYRLVLFIPKFKQEETLQGATFEFSPRLTNQQR